MKRFLLKVQYDGTAYAGWQRQVNGLAVQQVLEEALTDACGHRITVTGASRTDAGVHARGQMVHFDSSCTIPAQKFPFVLNTRLPGDIRVQSGRLVPDGFHARFMTCGKRYTYRIINNRHGCALSRLNHVHIPVPLDETIMATSLNDILGQHDFAAFQASGGTANTTIRTIFDVKLWREGDEIIFTVEGNAFLYNMVRIIAGTLIEIGQGKRSPDSFKESFNTLNRLSLGQTAPAHGLELTEVFYPQQAFLDPQEIRWHVQPNNNEND